MISPQRLKIVSGGQTGVDRAALDVALKLQFDYGGWCPQGGLAEDMLQAPGLLEKYPHLKETETPGYFERTLLNVKDSDATLILAPNTKLVKTGGTGYTIMQAYIYRKPYLAVLLQCDLFDSNDWFDDKLKETCEWLCARLREHPQQQTTLNIAGPRESKAPGFYQTSYNFLSALLKSPTLDT